MSERASLVLQVTAMATFVWFVLGAIVGGSLNGSLGYDFRAYYLAAERLTAGAPLYDASVGETGGFGLYLYPPPFLFLIVPLTAIPEQAAVYLFVAVLVVASVSAIALMPVSWAVRWTMLLLAGVSSPLLTAIVLGQVGPLLLLLTVLGWRWLDRQRRLGITVGLATMMKLQPGLLIGWALLTGRRRAAGIAAAVLAALAILATLVAGPQAWLDQFLLLTRVNRPALTPHAFGIGRLAYELGASEIAALVIYWINVAAVVVVAAIASVRAHPVASYLAVVIASQFVSPVLWDHYALILLVPTAWLLHGGRLWAAAIPLATSSFLIPLHLTGLYPAAFWAAILAVAMVGMGEQRDRQLVAEATAG